MVEVVHEFKEDDFHIGINQHTGVQRFGLFAV